MNPIKSKRRGSSNYENLDHLMRLRINGPKDLIDFSSAVYARAWLKNHARTDKPAGQKRKIVELEESDDENDLDVL